LEVSATSRKGAAYYWVMFTIKTQHQFINISILPNWQKEPWQTFEEASGYMRPERVNKWPNSMTDRG
jgi:hypothetical protein